METETSIHKLIPFWVRKLTGKPGGITPPDCEFDARRIHIGLNRYETDLLSLAAQSKAFRSHSALLCGEMEVASSIDQGIALRVGSYPVAQIRRGQRVK